MEVKNEKVVAQQAANLNQVVTLFNPMDEDFTFHWDKVPYTLLKKSHTHLPYFLASHGAKKLIDYIILHPTTWKEVGIKRDDTGNKRNADGQVINDPDVSKGREEIAEILKKPFIQSEPAKDLASS